MKRWYIIFMSVLCIITICSCKAKTETALEQDSYFPSQIYLEDNRVTVNCELEIHGDSRNQCRNLPNVNGQIYPNPDNAYQRYVTKKNIKEEYHDEGNNGIPGRDSYVFIDGGTMSVGPVFTFGTENMKYYVKVGATKEENKDRYKESLVSFIAGEDAVVQIKKALKDLEYPEEDFEYMYYPLNWESMKIKESEYINEGLIENDDIKDEWTEADNAYVIYAFQKALDLPVFHELMSITHELAFDTVDSAPVQAIFSTRGIEWLHVSKIYGFTDGREVELKNIDSIIQVVIDKYNNLLTESKYLVNRAKLYLKVSLDEQQKYKSSFIWYFEVVDDKGKKEVALVDAVSGKEIYLP